MFPLDLRQASWRTVAGHALVVSRATGRMHRLDRAGTEIWRILTAAAPASVDVDSICDALARSHPSTASAVDPVTSSSFSAISSWRV